MSELTDETFPDAVDFTAVEAQCVKPEKFEAFTKQALEISIR